MSDKPEPKSGGPLYEVGDARILYVGWLDADELKGGSGFRAIIEFPQGPPKLPMSVIWDGTPMTLSIKGKSPS